MDLPKCKCGCGNTVERPGKTYFKDHYKNPIGPPVPIASIQFEEDEPVLTKDLPEIEIEEDEVFESPDIVEDTVEEEIPIEFESYRTKLFKALKLKQHKQIIDDIIMDDPDFD